MSAGGSRGEVESELTPFKFELQGSDAQANVHPQGAYNNYAAIDAAWSDTMAFDNIRADGSGGQEVTVAETMAGLGNTVHTYSTNDTTY
jgi:hypothetical protein